MRFTFKYEYTSKNASGKIRAQWGKFNRYYSDLHAFLFLNLKKKNSKNCFTLHQLTFIASGNARKYAADTAYSMSVLLYHFGSNACNKPQLKMGKGGRHSLMREKQKGVWMLHVYQSVLSFVVFTPNASLIRPLYLLIITLLFF